MNYKKVDEADLEALRAIVGPEKVTPGDALSVDFCHDEMDGIFARPEVMVESQDVNEIAAVMKYANEHHIPVTPRGQGTGLVGASVTVHGGIMLNLSKMNRILELDEETFTLTVEPGVLLMDIYAFVEPHGLYYPPNPGEKSASIGGNVSTNAGGMSAVKYGVTRDYVRGLQVVTAEGKILNLGGKIAKNSTGYSLVQLITGSEGTLAVITKIILKLVPLPKYQRSLLLPYDSLPTALHTVPKIIQSRIVPRSIEFMTQDMLKSSEEYLGRKFPDHSAVTYLLLTVDGNSLPEIGEECDQLCDLCIANGAKDALIIDTDERTEAVWKPRSAYLEIIKASTTGIEECDVVVPIPRIAEFVEFAQSLETECGIRIRSMGHAGDGNLHIYLLKDDLSDEEWKKRQQAFFDKVYGRAGEIGGKISGEHGIGIAKRKWFHQNEGEDLINYMRAIKKAVDPNEILNPGKVI